MPGRGPPRGPMGYAPGPSLSYDSYGRPVDDPYGLQNPPPGPMREPSPGPIGMAVSQDTVGQAIEMQPQPRGYDEPPANGPMDHDAQPHALSVDNQLAPLESPSSMYSRGE